MIYQLVKALSDKLDLYRSFRYSWVYFQILKLKNPSYIRALNDDLQFYSNALGNGLGLIFDVGANHGDKTWAFRQLASQVVCFEPDEANFHSLSVRYSRQKAISIENVALGKTCGTSIFYVEEVGSAYNTLNEKEKEWILENRSPEIAEVEVKVKTIDAMISKYGRPDFLKIDVEGAELDVVLGLNHKIPCLSFEANLPRFSQETYLILDRLEAAGKRRYNLRFEDSFVFADHQPVDSLYAELSSDRDVSYDIFVYTNC
jgi:FkbM family methyltransferase